MLTIPFLSIWLILFIWTVGMWLTLQQQKLLPLQPIFAPVHIRK
jgi:hypothetical protein